MFFELKKLLSDCQAVRCEPRPTAPMQCSISRSYFSETTSTQRPRNNSRRYLANDTQSEWAARARRSLKFCEMQVRMSGS
jgi:hypothetical protein